MGNPIFEPDSEQDEQFSRDNCRHDRHARRRLDLARNPFRLTQNMSPSDRRRAAQVTRTSYRGDTFTIRGETYKTCLLHVGHSCIHWALCSMHFSSRNIPCQPAIPECIVSQLQQSNAPAAKYAVIMTLTWNQTSPWLHGRLWSSVACQ